MLIIVNVIIVIIARNILHVNNCVCNKEIMARNILQFMLIIVNVIIAIIARNILHVNNCECKYSNNS